jgi:uncharacterized tellurite resistance protein B-like protein
MRKASNQPRSATRHPSHVDSDAEIECAGMPIIALVFSTLGFWVIYWFVRMGGVDHVHAVLSRRKEGARRAAAREREQTAPLRTIDDPRDAATILMFLMARVGGDPTREQITAIEKIVRTVFELDGELVERITQARFIASRTESFEQAAGLFADLFNKRLTTSERLHLISMLREVAQVDGPSECQVAALQILQQRIGIAATL